MELGTLQSKVKITDIDEKDLSLTFEGGITKVPITDIRVIILLEQMLIELKKIEYHLMLATDTDLKEF